MTAPSARADAVRPVVPGILAWTVHDERIDFRSDAYAVSGAGGLLLIDPLPLEEPLLAKLGPVTAILLTAGCHQRWAWELRRRSGAAVWAPPGAAALDERPDRDLSPGEAPGGIRVIPGTGPSNPHVALAAATESGRRGLFAGDLVMQRPDGRWSLVPDAHHEDAAATRCSVRALGAEEWDILCPAHGDPLVGGVSAALREAAGAD